MMLILEYAPYGDLLGYLRKSRGLEDKYYSSPESCQQEVTSYDLLSFAQQVSAGMSFLASKKVCDSCSFASHYFNVSSVIMLHVILGSPWTIRLTSRNRWHPSVSPPFII